VHPFFAGFAFLPRLVSRPALWRDGNKPSRHLMSGLMGDDGQKAQWVPTVEINTITSSLLTHLNWNHKTVNTSPDGHGRTKHSPLIQ